MLSLTKLILIALIVFAVFGAGKLPKVMGDLGKGIRSLKEGLNGEEDATVVAKPSVQTESTLIEATRTDTAAHQAARLHPAENDPNA